MSHVFADPDKYPDCHGTCIQCELEWDDPRCPVSGSKEKDKLEKGR